MTKRRVFLFEYLSAGGDDVPAALRAEGVAMRDALRSDLSVLAQWSLSVAADPHDPVAASGVQPRSVWLTRRKGESVIDFVAREAAQHEAVWVVAPETGGVLANLCEAVPPQRWIGCDAASIRLTSSKQATVDRLHACGVATSRAFVGDPSVSAWVVKPDDGAGSVDTRRHQRLAQAQVDLAQRNDAAALEPWIDGEPLSVSLLVGANRAELLSVNRQHIVIDSQGGVVLESVEVDITVGSDQRAACARMASEVCAAFPGLAGLVGIDLVWHATRGPIVIEVNPRVTSAYVGLGASLGRNLAAEVLRLAPASKAASTPEPTTTHGSR